MNSDQRKPPDPPGGKAAERLREQLTKEFGEAPPESVPDEVERSAREEPDVGAESDTSED